MTTQQDKDALCKEVLHIADNLPSSIAGWNFQTYILGMLFYRYISQNVTNVANKIKQEQFPAYSYELDSDSEAETIRNQITAITGYYIKPSQLFTNVLKEAKGNHAGLNDRLTAVFDGIEEQSGTTLAGLFNELKTTGDSLKTNMEDGDEKALAVLDGIAGLDLEAFEANQADVFGDVYEYLLGAYASNSRKKEGQFFTPQCVSELVSRLAVANCSDVSKVYDPACGSGSLLLKFARYYGADKVQGYYGQELNPTTYNLARINMILHGLNTSQFDIATGDTLSNPKHQDVAPFSVIVSNMPFSVKWDGKDNPGNANDPRFLQAGAFPPKSKADTAFVLHMLYDLAADGVAVAICFPGILYRGQAEGKIRRWLIDNNYIDTIIKLPTDIFYGTSISTSVIIFKKNKPTRDIFYIDAQNEYESQGARNTMTEENITHILETASKRTEKAHYSHMATPEEIAKHGYKLTVSDYVEPEEEKGETINIEELEKEIDEREKEIKRLKKQWLATIQQIKEITKKQAGEKKEKQGKTIGEHMDEIAKAGEKAIHAVNKTADEITKKTTEALTGVKAE